jgi:ribonuclease HI
MPDGQVIELSGGEKRSTNNRMELMAAIRALESVAPGSDVVVYSDSRYVVDGMNSWVEGWRRKGWVTKGRRPVKNRELWERLDRARRRHQVVFRWVRGHAGVAGNERAHRLSQVGAMEACGHAIDFERCKGR